MKKSSLLMILLCMLLLLIPVPVMAQSGASLQVLNRGGRPVSAITDGDLIQLKASLTTGKVSSDTRISFVLEDGTGAIAECAIPAGDDTCTSSAFDSYGWYWTANGSPAPQRTIRAMQNELEIAATSLDVRPRPVVMVHGFISNWESWQPYLGPGGYLATLGLPAYAVGDGQVEGVMNTGDLSNPAQRTNTIARNAEILQTYIQGVQKATGAEKVDLLVHSMGGFISRYYIHSLMTERNIGQLIILGTPNGGSSCAGLAASLGFYLPGSMEILPDYMNGVFNKQITDRKGVPFHALAGTFILDPVAAPCTSVPSDTVVSLDSLTAIPLDYQEISLMHTDMTFDSGIFDKFVRPLLQTPPGNFWTAPAPAAVAPAPAPLQFSRVYTGHVDANSSQQVTITIDPNVTVASFALYDTSRSLDISVQGASGNTIQLDPVKNGLHRVENPETLYYLGYGFQQPKPGKWVVTLLATNTTPATGADFALAAKFEGGAVLDAATSLTLPELNQPVTISASLNESGQPLEIESASAHITRPDGSTETLALSASGDAFRTDYAPSMSGLYGVEVYVTAQKGEVSIDRAAFLTFETQPEAPGATRIWTTAGLLVTGIVLGLLILIGGLVWLVFRKRRG